MTFERCFDIVAANLMVVEAYHTLGHSELRDYQLGKCKHIVSRMNQHQWRPEQ